MLDFQVQQINKAACLKEEMDVKAALRKGNSVDCRGRRVDATKCFDGCFKSRRHRADVVAGNSKWVSCKKEKERTRAAVDPRPRAPKELDLADVIESDGQHTDAEQVPKFIPRDFARKQPPSGQRRRMNDKRSANKRARRAEAASDILTAKPKQLPQHPPMHQKSSACFQTAPIGKSCISSVMA